jgi:hypothetical protein
VIGADERADDGAPALCGRWLSVVGRRVDDVGSEGPAGVPICREQRRHIIDRINW